MTSQNRPWSSSSEFTPTQPAVQVTSMSNSRGNGLRFSPFQTGSGFRVGESSTDTLRRIMQVQNNNEVLINRLSRTNLMSTANSSTFRNETSHALATIQFHGITYR